MQSKFRARTIGIGCLAGLLGLARLGAEELPTLRLKPGATERKVRLHGHGTQMRMDELPPLQFTYHPVAGLPGFESAVAVDLDEQGWVLCRAANRGSGMVRGYLVHGEAVTDLGSLAPGGSTVPLGLDGAGWVVGKAQDAAGRWLPFVWAGGVMQALAVPGGWESGEARAVAPDGVIGGNLFRGSTQRAVLWTPDGLRFLPLTGAYGSSSLADVASGGRAAGAVFHAVERRHRSRPVVWQGEGAPQELEVPPNYTYGEARAINERGEVAGVSTEPPFARWRAATLWQEEQSRQFGLGTDLRDLNEAGDLVGSAEERRYRTLFPIASIWPARRNYARQFLSSWSPTYEELRRERAVAINEAGQVLIDASKQTFPTEPREPLLAEPLLPAGEPSASVVPDALPEDPAGPEANVVRPSPRPYWCEFIKFITALTPSDWNRIPRAFNGAEGTMKAGSSVGLSVVGIRGDGDYANITFEAARGARAHLKARLKVVPQSAARMVGIRYVEVAGVPRLILSTRPSKVDCTVYVTFRYDCRPSAPVFETVYTMKVVGSKGGEGRRQ